MLIFESVRNLQCLSWLYKRKVCFPEDRCMFLWSVRFAGLCVTVQSENMQRSLSWGLVCVMWSGDREHFTSTESSRPTPPARTQPCCCQLCPCPWSILQQHITSSTTFSFYQTCSIQKNNTTAFMGHRIHCQSFTYLYLFLVLIVVFIFSTDRSIFIYCVDSSLR